MGDTSSRGLKQSFGIMVNYHYVLPYIEENNQQYLLDGTISVTCSPDMDPHVKRAFSFTQEDNSNGSSDVYTISPSNVGGPPIKLRLVHPSLESGVAKL
jgi:hypothetical protein